jgi:probable rRNA maturation factor
MIIDLQIACDNKQHPSEEDFTTWAQAALQDPDHEAEVCIRLVNKEESQALNKQYRKKDKPTNVLSFAYSEDEFDSDPDFEAVHLGDLVICADLVDEEAEQQGKTATAHWAHLTVHGVLHLQGFDHEEKKAEEAMENLEIEILKKLGFNNPYEVKEK